MSSWFLLIIVTMALGFGTQAYINSSYRKYASVPNESGLTGAQIARRMLDDNGLQHVQVRPVAGSLSDHYDPRTQVVSLSEGVYDQASVSAMAIACHECGHAVQHARGYAAMKVRSALVPIANFGSSVWLILLLIGIFLNMMQLFWLGIIFYAFAVLFQIVTLPVEFNASRRALAYITGSSSGAVTASTQALAIPGDATADGAVRFSGRRRSPTWPRLSRAFCSSCTSSAWYVETSGVRFHVTPDAYHDCTDVRA